MKNFKFFDIVMAIFCVIIVVSNVLSSAKIVDFGISILGVPLAIDAGTLLFPISYIFGDVLTEVYGFKNAKKTIITGFVLLAITSIIFYIISVLPGEANWQSYAGDSAYTAILGGMSSGGIVLASLAGFLAGQFSNSIIMAKLKSLTKEKFLWLRTISSTLLGEFLDSLIFILVATLFGVFPTSLFVILVVSNYLFKCAVEIVMTPATYGVVSFLKRKEND